MPGNTRMKDKVLVIEKFTGELYMLQGSFEG